MKQKHPRQKFWRKADPDLKEGSHDRRKWRKGVLDGRRIR
ncbi:hypothetical protein SLEP1_g50223 [Rubroshorea leprosula]|uniref:Uncharacterized protein n=1 Tax=Rubroshorea leprosula TaxID=152421 RepID=A0AAV5LZA2_9ROSI|nr:hypothetical protein SLEP1_g50223 [Rubroshorea leprosula]